MSATVKSAVSPIFLLVSVFGLFLLSYTNQLVIEEDQR